jgi:hypothetical protein
MQSAVRLRRDLVLPIEFDAPELLHFHVGLIAFE